VHFSANGRQQQQQQQQQQHLFTTHRPTLCTCGTTINAIQMFLWWKLICNRNCGLLQNACSNRAKSSCLDAGQHPQVEAVLSVSRPRLWGHVSAWRSGLHWRPPCTRSASLCLHTYTQAETVSPRRDLDSDLWSPTWPIFEKITYIGVTRNRAYYGLITVRLGGVWRPGYIVRYRSTN